MLLQCSGCRIGWLKYLSFIYYSLQIMLFIQFDGGNRQIYSCTDRAVQDACALTNPSNPATSPDCQPVTDLQGSLGVPQDPSSQGEAIRNAFVLLGFLIFFRVLVYLVLRRKTARI